MYDERQHRELFYGPGNYLFRGNLPFIAYTTEYQGPSVLPTSVDPGVATLFGCRYLTEGPAVILLALKSDFADLLNGPNLASFWYEYAVNIELPPYEFEKRCRHSTPVGDSVAILDRLGYQLPARLPDFSALTQALMHSPKMLKEDIERYVELCQQFSKG